jgi:hypothetical protein
LQAVRGDAVDFVGRLPVPFLCVVHDYDVALVEAAQRMAAGGKPLCARAQV